MEEDGESYVKRTSYDTESGYDMRSMQALQDNETERLKRRLDLIKKTKIVDLVKDKEDEKYAGGKQIYEIKQSLLKLVKENDYFFKFFM